MKKIAIIVSVLIAILVVAHLAWKSYDPTVPYKQVEDRFGKIIYEAFKGRARPIVVESGYYPERIPFWIKYHPKYRKEPKRPHPLGEKVYEMFPEVRFGFGQTPGSTNILYKLGEKKMRCIAHYFRGRAASFSILHQKQLENDASLLAQVLGNEFPGLPIVIEESESVRIPIPINAGVSYSPQG